MAIRSYSTIFNQAIDQQIVPRKPLWKACGFCRWARPCHAFRSGSCRAGGQRRDREKPL